MNKFIILFLVFTSQVFANEIFKYYPSSSLPPGFERGTLPIPENTHAIKNISVLIFPHTLRSDWRHGGPDIKTKVQLVSETDFEIKSHERLLTGKSFLLSSREDGIEVTQGEEKYLLSAPLFFNANSAIKVLRFGNEAKSHSYDGEFKILQDSSGLKIINTIDMETYLRGVVPSESSPTWPLEALKAQALAARSYAIYHLLNFRGNREWQVDDTARYQVYSGIDHRQESTDMAVQSTAGEVITYDDEVIVAFFHAYSGGATDTAQNIFNSSTAPYCDSVKEVFTNEDLKNNIDQKIHWLVEWEKKWTKKSIMQSLSKLDLFKDFDFGQEFSIEVLSTNSSFNSVEMMKFSQDQSVATLHFKKLRDTLGWSKFNSYHYNFFDQDAKSLVIKGVGWGHHVGLSQWGAFMMAKNFNYQYRDIIKHYYSGVEITKVY